MHAHVIVDGSNLATEGRSKPSLAQLNEAVTTFMAEHPATTVTVVVDATFGHRIDKKERAEFDEAIANNELVAPPAGAIGRGDAFVLGIADKVGAAVLSNDSYQEFHGRYEWLFTEGRLIGGKPVPNVGWVFVERLPVRGPVSRRATAAGGAVVSATPRKSARSAARSVRLSAAGPPPVPKVPPPGTVAPAGRHANEVAPFAAFQQAHAVGSTVKGVVEAYSSHGATVRVGEATLYVPLRLLADPPPRSARDHLRLGDTVALMVAGYRPDRRSIDAGVPAIVRVVLRREGAQPATGPARAAQATRNATVPTARKSSAAKSSTAKKTATKSAKSTAQKTAKKTAQKTVKKTVTKSAQSTAKKTAKKTAKSTAKSTAKNNAKKTATKAAQSSRKPPAMKSVPRTSRKSAAGR